MFIWGNNATGIAGPGEQRRYEEAAIRDRQPELLDGLRLTEHGAGQSKNHPERKHACARNSVETLAW